MKNVITLGKLLSLWFCFLLLSILFLETQTSYRAYKIISSNELARSVMGNFFLVLVSPLVGLVIFSGISEIICDVFGKIDLNCWLCQN